MPDAKPDPSRVAIFGDSIAAGLGARGRSFPLLVSEALGARLVDVASSARQVGDSIALAERADGCEIAIVGHGATEALLRPTGRALRLVPAGHRRIAEQILGALEARSARDCRAGARPSFGHGR